MNKSLKTSLETRILSLSFEILSVNEAGAGSCIIGKSAFACLGELRAQMISGVNIFSRRKIEF